MFFFEGYPGSKSTCVVFLTFLWGGGAYKGSGGGVQGLWFRGGRWYGTEQISQLASTRTKRRKMIFFEGCPVGWGGTHRSWPGAQAGKPRALVAGEGLGGRRGWMAQGRGRRNTYKKQKRFFLKDTLWGGGGYKGSGGGVQGLWFREGRW